MNLANKENNTLWKFLYQNVNDTAALKILLKFIFTDLYKRSEVDTAGISLTTFHEWIALPMIISQKIFNLLDSDKRGFLQETFFVEDLTVFYSGSIDQRMNLIFRIFDFNSDQSIVKDDIILIFDYFHMMTNTHKEIGILHELIEEAFAENKISPQSMTFQEFTELVTEKNSDIFCLFQCLMFKYTPLTQALINSFRKITGGDGNNSQEEASSCEWTRNSSAKHIHPPSNKFWSYVTDILNLDLTLDTNENIADNVLDTGTQTLTVFLLKRRRKIKKYRLMLLPNALFLISFHDIKKIKRIISMKSTFIKLCEPVTIKNTPLYPMQIISHFNGMKYELTLFYLTEDDMKSVYERITIKTSYEQIKNEYIKCGKIGKGQFGVVRLFKNKHTEEQVAIKTIKYSKYSALNYELLKREIDICKFLMHCPHPGIVKCIDVIETSSRVHILFEYISGGSLSSYIGRLDNFDLDMIVTQVSDSLRYLHSFGIIHGDLKPENILVDTNRNILQAKIIDFGFGRVLGAHEFSKERYGSLLYASPELVSRSAYNHKTDIWSFGVVIYYLVYGIFPFDDDANNVNSIIELILSCKYRFPIEEKSRLVNISADLIIAIKSCLQRDIEKRYGIY